MLLILHRVLPDQPLLLAANRDELLDRPSSPPGLRDARIRVLCPHDKRAGGTWLGVNARGLVAALTNRADTRDDPSRASRGLLPLLALEQHSKSADAADAVRRELRLRPRNGFRLLLADAEQAVLVAGDGAASEIVPLSGEVALWTNEWGPEQADLAPVQGVLTAAAGQLEPLLEGLRGLLRGPGFVKPPRQVGEHSYGTVSSSLLVVARAHPAGSRLEYAAGRPDQTAYANYSNLFRRL